MNRAIMNEKVLRQEISKVVYKKANAMQRFLPPNPRNVITIVLMRNSKLLKRSFAQRRRGYMKKTRYESAVVENLMYVMRA